MPSRVEEPLEANLDNMESVNGNSTTIGVEKKENEMVGKKEEKKPKREPRGKGRAEKLKKEEQKDADGWKIV